MSAAFSIIFIGSFGYRIANFIIVFKVDLQGGTRGLLKKSPALKHY
jgi:hypothetical protein